MEQLRTELSHLLGEKLSRVECISEKPSSALWSLYDAQGNPLPLLARSFTTPGRCPPAGVENLHAGAQRYRRACRWSTGC